MATTQHLYCPTSHNYWDTIGIIHRRYPNHNQKWERQHRQNKDTTQKGLDDMEMWAIRWKTKINARKFLFNKKGEKPRNGYITEQLPLEGDKKMC